MTAGAVEAGRLALYDDTARRAAGVVVRRYSTSFGLATRLLPRDQRAHICSVYALVRLADEVVDGASQAAGADPGAARSMLDALETETRAAIGSGYSTNVLVHAFAATARSAGFGAELVAPFFAAMRSDLEPVRHDPQSLRDYVYGSAEVVGLMCLRVFLMGVPAPHRQSRYDRLAAGARALGSAFQVVNFLRDLAEDAALGRRYLPVDPSSPTARERDAVLAGVHADLRTAAAALPGLPRPARRAVGVAYALYAELAERLAATPPETLAATRVRVPGPVKAGLVVGAVVRTPRAS